MKQYELHAGHCLDVLAAMPAGAVQACITSPPYWNLRNYQTDPQVWGGDPFCQHVWQSDAPRKPGQVAQTKNLRSTVELAQAGSSGATCQRCGAWLGELGGEPDSELFIAHLVEVFRAVRRTMRNDAVALINMGDSYSNAGYSNQGRTTHENGGKPRYTPAPATTTRMRLRADLTPEQQAYVLAELAAARQSRKVGRPELTPGVNEAVTPLAGGE